MVWWWIGNAMLLLVVIPLVVLVASGLVRRTREVRDYASDILAHGLGIATNLDPIPALADTAGLIRVTRDAAAQYAAAVEVLLGRSR